MSQNRNVNGPGIGSFGSREKHSYAMVCELVETHRCSINEIANRMGCILGRKVEKTRLYGWMNAPGKQPSDSAGVQEKKAYSKRIDPICRLDRFVQHSQDFAVMDWLSDHRGGIWVRREETKIGDQGDTRGGIVRDWYRTWSGIHSLRSEIKEAFEDDRQFNSAEADAIAIRWLRVQRWIEEVLMRWEDTIPSIGSVTLSGDAGHLKELPSWAVFANAVEGIGQQSYSHHQKTDVGTELPRETRQQKKRSQEALANHIGLSRESIRNWWKRPMTQERVSAFLNPLDECLALMEATESNMPLEWLSARHGGFVVPGTSRREIKDILRDWMETHLEWAELECALGRFVLDGSKSGRSNTKRVRKEWEDVKECMPTLIGAISADAMKQETR